MWDLPRPGLEPVSPALAGGFLTTAPPGKTPCPLLTLTPLLPRFIRHDQTERPGQRLPQHHRARGADMEDRGEDLPGHEGGSAGLGWTKGRESPGITRLSSILPCWHASPWCLSPSAIPTPSSGIGHILLLLFLPTLLTPILLVSFLMPSSSWPSFPSSPFG